MTVAAPKCDFCSSAEPRYLESAEDFEVTPASAPEGRSVSTGDWSSCPECHVLVSEHKWAALERRAVEAMVPLYPDIPKNRIRAAIRYLHDKFRKHQPPGA